MIALTVSLLSPLSARAAGPVDDAIAAVGAAASVVQRPGVAPVVLTGAQIPTWSRLAATGTANPPSLPSGPRDAHNGTLMVPPDTRPGAPVDAVAAFRWSAEDGEWVEVPVQVDERFPYFLANFNSSFGIYSQTDMELTYAWDEERWLRTAGQCSTEYPAGVTSWSDPVPTLDDDDEIAFMASDAGDRAPAAAFGPAGTDAKRQEVAVVDPVTGDARFVYLFTRASGSTFDASTGYVDYQRAADADQWIDRTFFAPGDPENLGSSNPDYGPNIGGDVCPDGITPKPGGSSDRFPRDGVTVTTDTYMWTATGRWMVRGIHVAQPGAPGAYGPDLVDRWKGRAFQQSPDSEISLVGFEDEQVNWEANSALLGERVGPVRAIRETWGADSGTNVTKTETFYRDAIVYRYRLRVHPIPPDGLYTSWDYNRGVAERYYSPAVPEGVDVDGVDDEKAGNVDGIPGFTVPVVEREVEPTDAYFDAPDPTLNAPAAILTWEQVSGAGSAGSLVYVLENKGPTSLTEPLVVPYYRDDACLDDGTGDNPVPRPWPGEPSTDARVQDGYAAAAGKPYAELACTDRQGAFGSHGVHFFATGDTDNAFVNAPVPVNEVDAQQWQFAVPTAAPQNVGHRYSLEVRAPVTAAVVEQDNVPQQPTVLTVDAPGSVQATDALAVTVRLADAAGAAVAGAPVEVALRGRVVRATTDGDGAANVVVDRVPAPAGIATLTATYAGSGDGRLQSSSAERSVEVVRDDSVLHVRITGARRLHGVEVALDDADGGPLAGRDVDVFVDGIRIATVRTLADGSASTVTTLKRGAIVTARFAGDDSYLPAAATATAT
ncbi:MAG TPA: hypothetical protein VF230_17115 [Acidimicrobiales bacterium]